MSNAWGLELRFKPPSRASHALMRFSHVSKLSGSAS